MRINLGRRRYCTPPKLKTVSVIVTRYLSAAIIRKDLSIGSMYTYQITLYRRHIVSIGATFGQGQTCWDQEQIHGTSDNAASGLKYEGGNRVVWSGAYIWLTNGARVDELLGLSWPLKITLGRLVLCCPSYPGGVAPVSRSTSQKHPRNLLRPTTF